MTITRFAPSPTGDLHIGGVRTALFCWIHARQHQGTFRLRIEDTDQTRSTEASTQVILDGLNWLGLDYDGEIVYQSKRFDVYNAIIDRMIEQGLAYYCWCTPEELDAMREEQKAKGEKPRYNGKYRHGGEPVDGVTPVVRFKNPQEGVVSFDDKVRGRITISNAELDDFIIRRSDGTPTYNFCVVVDDAEQHISLVIRGDDHINNTPRQINIYQALGYPVPDFAHVPMILGDDGKRLSKRHGATNVLDYRKEGYLPEAVLNYLLRLGWSHGDQEIFSIEEMLQYFRIEDVHSAAAAFNTEKLRWLNQHYMKQHTAESLLNLLKPYLNSAEIKLNDDTLLSAIPHYQERAKTLKEMAEKMAWIARLPETYPDAQAKKAFKGEKVIVILQDMIERLSTVQNYDEQHIHEAIEACVSANEVGFGKVGQPVRFAVTAGEAAPDLAITLALIGQQESIVRLQKAIKYINENKE